MAKSNGIAVLLSLIIPGTGQIYKEHVFRGLLWMAVMVIIIPMVVLSAFALFGLFGVFLSFIWPIAWIGNVADAYYLKEKIKGKSPRKK